GTYTTYKRVAFIRVGDKGLHLNVGAYYYDIFPSMGNKKAQCTRLGFEARYKKNAFMTAVSNSINAVNSSIILTSF
ncbi:hypothetical protein, partial [Vibrio ordalii]|uniref:hypothetical protein n=1 Tax=Vibrio ordalii TaxID=28174 RepID=UPI0005715D58